MTMALPTISEVMRRAPVIPVMTVDDADQGYALAAALVRGGLSVLEVTLRTPAALDAIRAMADVPGALVGAGTVLDERQLDRALAAGARFVVSPGLTERLAHAAIERGIAFLPGIATAADIMRGLDLGLDRFKFFPALAAGGIPALAALSAPFRQCRFCPTGGIVPATAADWLALDAVDCVGGSWLTSDADLAVVERRARAAAALKQSGFAEDLSKRSG